MNKLKSDKGLSLPEVLMSILLMTIAVVGFIPLLLMAKHN